MSISSQIWLLRRVVGLLTFPSFEVLNRSAIYGSEKWYSGRIVTNIFSVQTVPPNSYNFNVDNIRVCKILGSGVQASRTMNGMVFQRGAEGEIKKVDKARIAVYTCPFDLTQTETKVHCRFLIEFFRNSQKIFNCESKFVLHSELFVSGFLD